MFYYIKLGVWYIKV